MKRPGSLKKSWCSSSALVFALTGVVACSPAERPVPGRAGGALLSDGTPEILDDPSPAVYDNTLADYAPRYDYAVAYTNNGGAGLSLKAGNAETEGCDSTWGFSWTNNPSAALDALDIKFHPQGGGYVGCAKIDGSANFAAERYGQGWQWSTRANSGAHNPTQAGSSEWLGTVVQMSGGAKRIDIAKNRVPLFQNSSFDFVKHEELWPDDRKPGEDCTAPMVCNSPVPADQDGLDADDSWSEISEVMSEFTTGGRYKKMYTVNGIPAYAFQFYMAYELKPTSLRQFTVTGVKDNDCDENGNCELVWDPSKIPQKLSLSPQRQGASGPSTYNYIKNSYGFRNDSDTGIVFTHFYSMNGLPEPIPGPNETIKEEILGDLKELELGGAQNPGSPLEGGDRENKGIALAMLSTSSNPATGVAIGLFVPRSKTNRASVLKYRKSTGQALAEKENRRTQSFFVVPYRNAQTNLVYRHTISGLYPSNYIESDGSVTDLVEVMYTDVIQLFGTPNEIRCAVCDMVAKHMRQNEEWGLSDSLATGWCGNNYPACIPH